MSSQERQSSFSYEEISRPGHGELFGKDAPRLPLPPMLMFDRITDVSEDGGAHNKGHISAELDVKPDLWFFKCHFEGDPVMPGCLGLDAMWQMVGFFMSWVGAKGKGRAISVGEVKFTDMVLPSASKVSYHIDFKRVMLRKLILGIADGIVKVDGKTSFVAKDLRVGVFNDAENAQSITS